MNAALTCSRTSDGLLLDRIHATSVRAELFKNEPTGADQKSGLRVRNGGTSSRSGDDHDGTTSNAPPFLLRFETALHLVEKHVAEKRGDKHRPHAPRCRQPIESGHALRSRLSRGGKSPTRGAGCGPGNPSMRTCRTEGASPALPLNACNPVFSGQDS